MQIPSTNPFKRYSEVSKNPDAGRIAKCLALANASSSALNSASEIYGLAKLRFGYTVSISSHEELYYPAQRWVMDNLPESKRRAMMASFYYGAGDLLHFRYDGDREQFLKIDGHRVSIKVHTPTADAVRDPLNAYRPPSPDRLVFTAFTAAGRDAIVNLLKQITDDHIKRRDSPPHLYVWAKGQWQSAGDLSPRRRETVVLAPGQLDRIISSMERFRASEEKYTNLGLPWHHGFLFDGPPGTGKSSIARMLGTVFSMNVYYLSVAGLETNEDLLMAVSGVRRNSILLLEDFDAVGAAQDRDKTDITKVEGVTADALYNVLDGVMTPHGLVAVLTTNHRSAIDQAVLRPGRVDLAERIGFVDEGMAREIYQVAYNAPCPPLGPVQREVSPAQVVGALKPYLGDPEAGLKALVDLWDGESEVEAVRVRPVARISNSDGDDCSEDTVPG